jgi:hypothetical protein
VTLKQNDFHWLNAITFPFFLKYRPLTPFTGITSEDVQSRSVVPEIMVV